MAVEFQVLGTVAVRMDGAAVELGHARQRCVLAVLLVDAGRVVPVDALLERVWSGRAPRHARNALSGYVSRLRGVPGVCVLRESGGYRLAVDPMTVDLHRFRALVGEARAAADDELAIARLDRALGLWQGMAFGALDTPWLGGVREALDAERQAAELDRNDLALRLGRHGEALAGIGAAADAHPLDERLAGQLMLALYRDGRQADALHRYQRIRTALADELGADPGPPLRELHQRILRADPGLAGASPVAGRPVPRQLPAAPRAFAGRRHELDVLDAIMDSFGDAPPPAVIITAVCGTAGVGKTALAVHWAHHAAARFPDGQLYVNLRGFDPHGSVLDPDEVVHGFLDALGVPPERIPAAADARAALYRSLLADRRTLVVLDNARDAEQVRALLPGAAGCLVVVTSRDRLTGLVAGEGAHPLTVDLLTVAEARALLAGRLGAARVSAESEAVRELITHCAGLPLALAIVAARAAVRPGVSLGTLADELREHSGLDALTGSDPQTDPRAVFSWSYRVLGPAPARLFRLLGLHLVAEISVAAAASLAAVAPGRARSMLAELAEVHLVTESAPDRFTMHDLLYAYAMELARCHDGDADRRRATHRMLDHYLHTAHAADRLLHPHWPRNEPDPAQDGVTAEEFGDHRVAMAWFVGERPVLLAAVRRSVAAGFSTHTWQLARALNTFLGRRAHWHDWAYTQRVAVDAARGLGETQAQAEAHWCLALASAELGRFDEAHTHLRRAIDLYARLGDRRGLARTHLAVAWTCGRQDRETDAQRHGRTALELYRQTGDRVGQAKALNAVAWSAAQLGDEAAIGWSHKAIALQCETGDRYGEAASWDTLGYAHHRLGNYEQALANYRKALHIHAAVGDRYDETVVLDHLGETYSATGDLARAREAWQAALAILTDIGHPDAERVRLALNRTPTGFA